MRRLALTVAIACLSTVAVAADPSSTGAQGRSPGTATNAAGNMGAAGSTGHTGNMGATGGTGATGAHGTMGATGSSGNMGTAGGGNMGNTAGTGASGVAGVTTGPATGVGKPAPKGAGDAYLATEFWGKNAKDGYLSKEDAGRFKGSDGKMVNMKMLDMDNDGRVSEREWTSYHQKAGAAGARPEGSQGQSAGSK